MILTFLKHSVSALVNLFYYFGQMSYVTFKLKIFHFYLLGPES